MDLKKTDGTCQRGCSLLTAIWQGHLATRLVEFRTYHGLLGTLTFSSIFPKTPFLEFRDNIPVTILYRNNISLFAG